MRTKTEVSICAFSLLLWAIPAVARTATGETLPVTAHNSATADFYPNTVDGLHDFLQSFVVAIKNKDLGKTSRLERSLIVPEYHNWFARVYGPAAASELADVHYTEELDLPRHLSQCGLDELSEIKVSRVAFSDEQSANASGIQFFRRMRHPVPVYTVYLADPENQTICALSPVFVYVNRGFRILYEDFGKIEEGRRPKCTPDRMTPARYRIDGSRMESKLLRPAHPIPFPDAKVSGASKAVMLLAIIGCDGTVLGTRYVSGPPSLFRAASDSAQERQYEQTLMNGRPAEVLTTITIVFSPGG